MAIALAGNVYQMFRAEHMKRDLTLIQKNTQTQITKLNDASAAMLEENRQRFEAIKAQLQQTEATVQAKAKSQP